MKRETLKRLCLLVFVFAGGTGTIPAVSQAASGDNLAQYLLPKFDSCRVIMKTGTVNRAVANYNTVTQKMVFRKDDGLYNMTNPAFVDTILIGKRRFVPGAGFFYEVLSEGRTALLIQHRSDLIPAGKPAPYGGTSSSSSVDMISSVSGDSEFYNLNLPDGYKVKASPVYWLRMDGRYNSFINAKQFVKIFPGQESEIRKFISSSRIRFTDPSDVIKLAEHFTTGTK